MNIIVKNYDYVQIEGKGMYIPVNIWDHTNMRIDNAIAKAKEKETKGKDFMVEFNKLMETRLYKMEKLEKLYCAIGVLHKKGYEDLAETYYSKIVLKRMTGEI